MGTILSCCEKSSPAALDERASLRAGGRIKPNRANDNEDPRAPFFSKIEQSKIDKDMDQFVADLGDDIEDITDSDEFENVVENEIGKMD